MCRVKHVEHNDGHIQCLTYASPHRPQGDFAERDPDDGLAGKPESPSVPPHIQNPKSGWMGEVAEPGQASSEFVFDPGKSEPGRP
jgi:hypothetical protein